MLTLLKWKFAQAWVGIPILTGNKWQPNICLEGLRNTEHTGLFAIDLFNNKQFQISGNKCLIASDQIHRYCRCSTFNKCFYLVSIFLISPQLESQGAVYKEGQILGEYAWNHVHYTLLKILFIPGLFVYFFVCLFLQTFRILVSLCTNIWERDLNHANTGSSVQMTILLYYVYFSVGIYSNRAGVPIVYPWRLALLLTFQTSDQIQSPSWKCFHFSTKCGIHAHLHNFTMKAKSFQVFLETLISDSTVYLQFGTDRWKSEKRRYANQTKIIFILWKFVL